MNFSLRCVALAAAAAALTGGRGPYGAPPSSWQGQPIDPAPTPTVGCSATLQDSKGPLADNVLGTWQDWSGNSYQVTTFEGHTVTVSSFPLDANGLADQT